MQGTLYNFFTGFDMHIEVSRILLLVMKLVIDLDCDGVIFPLVR